jgi:Tfp pilus assembly protein PilO
MTGRDRMVVIGIVVIAVLGVAWMMVVSPERSKAGQLDTQVAAAQAQLASAESQVSSARAAQSQYATAYASLVSLGKAVPPTQEVPSLIEELAHASDQKQVDFSSITSSGATGSGASSAAAATTAGLSQLPFTFVFEGSYFDLEHLFNQLAHFATLNDAGDLQVNGRLLTIQSVRLAPASTTAESGKPSNELTGSITATAYVQPASQGVTGATGTASPAGATVSPAASSTSASSPTSPAIVSVKP